MKSRTKLSRLLVITIILLVGSIILFIQLSTKKTIEHYARDIAHVCADEEYAIGCYENMVPKLVLSPTYLSMEDAFKVTEHLQNIDHNFNSCHVLAHNISSNEVTKNPDNWKSVLTQCPKGTCANGCMHGAFQERYKKESLSNDEIQEIKPELKSLCAKNNDWISSDLDQGSCYHALGHLFTYLTNKDFEKSLALCEEIIENSNGRQSQRVCFDGIFMQLFQPDEGDPYLGKQVDPSQIKEFCNNFSGKRHLSCLTQSWFHFTDQLQNAKGINEFCNQVSPSDRRECLGSVFYMLPFISRMNEDLIIGVCSDFQGDQRSMCFSGSGLYLLGSERSNIDTAVNFCKKTIQVDQNQSCYSGLAQNASFIYPYHSDDHLALCRRIPDKWKQECLSEK